MIEPLTSAARAVRILLLSAEQQRGDWTSGQLVRVDNLFNREHVGSVIVGNAQRRYFEPGPTRRWYAGVSGCHAF